VKTADLFVDDGLLLTVRRLNPPDSSYIGKAEGSFVTFPMVCLVNRDSVAGSELVAACLQDHHRAEIGGERSYGIGTMTAFQKDADLKKKDVTYLRPSVIPSVKREPVLSGNTEPLGAESAIWSGRRARVAQLVTRMSARSEGRPGVMA
jgi:hypothetical protein